MHIAQVVHLHDIRPSPLPLHAMQSENNFANQALSLYTLYGYAAYTKEFNGANINNIALSKDNFLKFI